MRISKIHAVSAMAVAVAATVAAAPEGFDNAAGYWVGGKLNVSPFFDISYQRDDNPNSHREFTKQRAKQRGLQKQDEEANTMVMKGGLNLLLPGNSWRLDGRFFVNHEASSHADTDDRTDFYENLRLRGWTEAGTQWNIYERYQDIRYDDDFELSRDDRKVVNLGAGAEFAVTEKSRVLVGGSYTDYNYDEDTNYDYSVLRGNVGFAHDLTEKTDWTVDASYRTYDKDGYDSNAWGVKGLVGIRTRSTEKLTFNASIGAERFRDYEYSMYAADGTYLGKKSKGDDETSFVYSLSGAWKMAKRLSLTFGGHCEYEPAQDVGDNSLLENAISTVLTYAPGDHWKLNCGVAYERDEYNRKVANRADATGNPYTSVERGGKDRTDDEMRYFATVSYAINKFCSVYVNWRYTDINSSIDGYDYDRTRYGAGIHLRY